MDSPMLWDPIHWHESCPSSDGACAMVMTTEDARGARRRARRRGCSATAMRIGARHVPGPRPGAAPGRRRVRARWCSRPRGSPTRSSRSTSSEIYVPFSWYEPMWLEGHDLVGHGEAWKLIESGDTNIGGKFPVNPSGGVLSSNPIGASGMLRFAEAASRSAAWRVSTRSTGRTVALGQAYGGAAQYFAMWVVGATLDAVEQKPRSVSRVRGRRRRGEASGSDQVTTRRGGRVPRRGAGRSRVGRATRRTRCRRDRQLLRDGRQRPGDARRATSPGSKEWQRKLFDEGWAGITRPDRVRRPRRRAVAGADLPPGAGPLHASTPGCSRCRSAWSCRRSSRTAPRSRSSGTSRRCCAARRSGASSSREPGAGSDLAGLTTRADARRRRVGRQRPEGLELGRAPRRLRRR